MEHSRVERRVLCHQPDEDRDKESGRRPCLNGDTRRRKRRRMSGKSGKNGNFFPPKHLLDDKTKLGVTNVSGCTLSCLYVCV